jgi:hypothetical protein
VFSSSAGNVTPASNGSVTPASNGSVVPASNGSVTPASNGSSTLALRGTVKFPVSVGLNGRTLQVTGGQATIHVFDMQGRPLARFDQVSGAIGLEMLNSGNYILRIKSGGQVQNRRIMLK